MWLVISAYGLTYGLLYHAISDDLERHSPTASLFKCDFSYSCVAADKTSTDAARCVVPQQ